MAHRLPFHFRCIADSGVTVRQSTRAFRTFEEADKAAKHADRIHNEEHVVCISLDPKDPRNSKDTLRAGFKVYEPERDAVDDKASEEVAPAPKRARRK